MANKFFRKLNGLLTAAALCVSCLPFGGMLSASAADVQETIPGMTQSPEQLIQEADRGDFLTLGYAVMQLRRCGICFHALRKKQCPSGR